jgi:osmotically-inducible protein OsmY
MERKSDAQIQADVMQELRWDTRVTATDVGVEVKDGIVTLTGTVPSWTMRLAAADAAHRVAGVLDVANDLTVKLPGSPRRTDGDIAAAVRMALEWDVLVPHERIRSTVTDGVVTLEGDVDFWNEYDDAARAVRNLAGVREVKNLITVDPRARPVATSTVRSAIEEALLRHAIHAARHVNITVAEGAVYLSGEVKSWPEYRAVIGAVRGTPGVKKVESTIRVQP